MLPTVGVARFGDRSGSVSAGPALHAVQVAVVLTYFLASWASWASWAKVRFRRVGLADRATLARAIVRRGTVLSNWPLDCPDLLEVGQFLMVGAELR